jgi:hypothetical protein
VRLFLAAGTRLLGDAMDFHTLQHLGQKALARTNEKNPVSAPHQFRCIQERTMSRATRMKRPSGLAKKENVQSMATDSPRHPAFAARSLAAS